MDSNRLKKYAINKWEVLFTCFSAVCGAGRSAVLHFDFKTVSGRYFAKMLLCWEFLITIYFPYDAKLL